MAVLQATQGHPGISRLHEIQLSNKPKKPQATLHEDTHWLHFLLGFTPGRVPGLNTAPIAIPNSARDFFTELP